MKKAHQRIIRERHADELDPIIDEKRRLATMDNASVREVPVETAKEVILKYEWLGTMGSSSHRFGLYFGEHLAGVVCFGTTAGSNTAESVCPEYPHIVKTLNRGACVHWAHPHSASFLITRACRMMAERGFHVFVAYSDPEAGEIGTVYQASNWLYCGQTSASSMWVWAGRPVAPRGRGKARGLQARINLCKDGKARDERLISAMCRDRANSEGAYRALCSRREMRERLIREGFVFYQTSPKHRYVHIAGTRNEVRALRAGIGWHVEPYPKRLLA